MQKKSNFIDFKIFVIEINPFQVSTDSALFSWEHERSLLESGSFTEFRIVERPKQGSKAMLSLQLRSLIE